MMEEKEEIIVINGKEYLVVRMKPITGPIIFHTPIEVMGKLDPSVTWEVITS